MISDTRFDELVARAGKLTNEVCKNLPEGDWFSVYRSIFDHLINNENGMGIWGYMNHAATRAQIREAQLAGEPSQS